MEAFDGLWGDSGSCPCVAGLLGPAGVQFSTLPSAIISFVTRIVFDCTDNDISRKETPWLYKISKEIRRDHEPLLAVSTSDAPTRVEKNTLIKTYKGDLILGVRKIRGR